MWGGGGMEGNGALEGGIKSWGYKGHRSVITGKG